MQKWVSLCAAGFVIAGIAGCGPWKIPYVNVFVARAYYQTDGAIEVTGGNFTPSTGYNVGIFTNGAPRMIGQVQSDAGGFINPTTLEYSCRTTLQAPLNVEIYIINGPGLAQSNTGFPTCW